MDEQKNLEARWRELDELLGLPAGTSSAATPKEPTPEPPVIKAYEEPRSRIEEEVPRPVIHEEHDAPTIPMVRDETAVEWEEEFEEDDDDTSLEDLQAPRVEEPAAEEEGPVGPAPVAGEEEKPRRGRRRRRRGRRRGGDK